MHGYRTTLLILWTAGTIAAAIYSRQNEIPVAVAVPVALAMLVELSFYAGLAFEQVRQWCASLGWWLSPFLVASAIGALAHPSDLDHRFHRNRQRGYLSFPRSSFSRSRP